MGVGEQFLSIVSEFLSDRSLSVHLDGKVSESINGVSGVPRIAFSGRCLYCTPPNSSTLLGTILWAMRIILRCMQLFLDRFRVLK